jgi:hypothetical protein
MAAKVELLNKWCDSIDTEDESYKHDLKDALYWRDVFTAKYNDDLTQISGDAKIFSAQVQELVSGQLSTLLQQIETHEQVTNKSKEIYANYTSENTNLAVDNFRLDVLKHLAGKIVVKEHRLRYQQEQWLRYVIST